MDAYLINTILQGDALTVLKTLPDESIDCIVTSPPYWKLRNYGVEGQLGQEETFQEYIARLCDIFDEAKRVLKPQGTCWVNMGDTYADTGVPGLRAKSLVQIPNRFAIEMTQRGWILRNEIIWHKPNAMPSSAKNRFTVDFEKVFFFTKNARYHFEQQIEPYLKPLNRWGGDTMVPKSESRWDKGTGQTLYRQRDHRPDPRGRNKRTVWVIPTRSHASIHTAVFPEALIETPIKAGCPVGGIVLDPFMGAGTTAIVAKKLSRQYLGIELNPEYIQIAEERILCATNIKKRLRHD